MSAHPPEGELAAGLDRLARFSASGRGVTRLAYDDAWCEAHRWLVSSAAERGLGAAVDWAGNLLFRPRGARNDDRAPVMVGSHLDSVVEGGTLDGAYGLWAGLLIAAACGDGEASRDSTGSPVIAFATCEEEGSRFPGTMMGARALLGMVESAELDSLHDTDGVTWRKALDHACACGCAEPLTGASLVPGVRPRAMVELHIEQGPRLDQAQALLGIVDGIAGYCRLEARITGVAAHAGTTPMGMRHDALAAAAELALAVERVARERTDPAVATVGDARAHPGLFNVVAGRSDLKIELRHTSLRTLEEMKSELGQRARAIAEARGVDIEIEPVAEQPPVPMDVALVARAERLASRKGIAYRRMASGAGHDAMVFARAGVPSVMVFVPSQGGVSHAPDEFTPPHALELGYQFTLELVREIAAS